MKHLLRILFLFTLFSFRGCETNKDLVQDLWVYSQQHPQGFTVTIPYIEPVLSGIAVAYKETQNSVDYASLGFVVNHALSHNQVVGGWLNEINGLYYFDSIKLFNDNEMEEAIAFAIENEQTAIYDLTNNKTIYVDEYSQSDAA